MEITLSEFDLERYTRRRMRELRGEVPEHRDVDPFVERYTARRIREICLERELAQRKIDLDNVALGGYTVATMEVYRPDER
tara:strand:+ start:47 stop:289 length:243 start_codon:yes stop_codon:yes gene_type:complete